MFDWVQVAGLLVYDAFSRNVALAGGAIIVAILAPEVSVIMQWF